MEKPETITNPCKYDSANYLSKGFFWFCVDLLRIGLKRELTTEDLYRSPQADETLRATTRFERLWDQEISYATSKGKRPSLARALIKTFGLTTLINGIFLAIDDSLNLVQTLLIGLIVRYFSNNSFSDVTWEQCLYYSIALVLTLFLYGFIRHQVIFMADRQGIQVCAVLTAVIYKKLLTLSRSSTNKTDVGHFINIITTDLMKFDELTYCAIYLVLGPLMAISVLIYMIHILGLACLGAVIVLILLIPCIALIGRFSNQFRTETALLTDKRVKSMEEMISAIKIVKMFTWEQSFADIISSIRRKEMIKNRNSATLRLLNFLIHLSTVRIMIFASLVFHVFLGRPLTPELAFTTLSLCNAIRVPVTWHIGYAVGLFFESKVSVKRIEELLFLDSRSVDQGSVKGDESLRGSIILDNYIGKWDKSSETVNLKKVNLRVGPGELLVVIGTVGSGKTCLMLALLDEIATVSGHCKVHGKKSYSPQESWTFADSIKQNILFGREYSKEKYRKVIEVCSLNKDLQSFPYGDLTVAGEKGHSLSGGQKARITLARAVYEDADVYLFDDPLSAVDPGVAEHLFDKCINGYLKGKTRVLITHQLQFLKRADKILIMNEGETLAFGTFEQLKNLGIDFIKFLKETSETEPTVQSSDQVLSIDELYGEKVERAEPKFLVPLKLTNLDDEKMIVEKQMESREEKMSIGSLNPRVYWEYLSAGTSSIFVILFILSTTASQSLISYVDWWISRWSDESQALANAFNETTEQTDFKTYSRPFVSRNTAIYSSLMVAMIVTAFLRLGTNYRICLRSAETLHNRIFGRLLRTPLHFFETNPSGRILNRFTRDIGIIDVIITNNMVNMNLDLCTIIGFMVITAVVLPVTLVVAIFFLFLMCLVRQMYLKVSRFMARMQAKTKSPIYNQITSTFEGLTTIRAFQYESMFIKQLYHYLNDHNACRFIAFATNRVTGMILDLSIILLLTVILSIVLAYPDSFPGGKVGLLISTLLNVFVTLQYGIKLTAEFETNMISVERVLEYDKLEPEPQWQTGILLSGILPKNWPMFGDIKFKNVYLTYPGSVKPVLKNLNLTVSAGEKIGIVGRTGAGKSSLISVLFRLTEFEGTVFVDGVDIKQLGLHDLRKKISIIPQDPLLFTGTIRSNLDPLNEYSDDYIWSTLNTVNLARTIKAMDGGLDAKVTQGGSNLSLGQRQLLCLIRALLQRNKIMILDEATSNMDHQTDTLIQETIRKEFKDCTVLTVAHRLNTIIDMDKILMMDGGEVIEYGEPYQLLKQVNGPFKSLVSKTGPTYTKMLLSLAEKSYFLKHPTGSRDSKHTI